MSSAATASGAVSVNCNVAYAITLGDGNQRISGGYRQMAMTQGSSTYYLPYQLYTASNYSTPWVGTTSVSGASTAGASVATSVYGKIDAGTALPLPGDYSDSVVVTVTY